MDYCRVQCCKAWGTFLSGYKNILLSYIVYNSYFYIV